MFPPKAFLVSIFSLLLSILVRCDRTINNDHDHMIITSALRLKRSARPEALHFSPQQQQQHEQQERMHSEQDEQSILDEQRKQQQQQSQQQLLQTSRRGIWPNVTSSIYDSVTPFNCGYTRYRANDNIRIVGGRSASSGQFPWQVFLRIVTPNGEMLCGGSIINQWWILTAAHCISNEQTGEYMATAIEVVAGSLDRFRRDPNRQSRYADCALKHPNWRGVRGGFANDIALIRLPNYYPLYLNADTVRSICLPPRSNPPFEYTGVARVSGWGLTRDRGSTSRILQYTDVNVISDNQCRRYQYPVDIIDSMVCQGVDHSSPCQGDSGGPLIIRRAYRYVQFGVVSFGPGICNNGRIPNAVYTQVSYHLTWIENTIRSYQRNSFCQPRRIPI